MKPIGMSTNKRIAANTALLYVRMLITMVISLYTSRVVLYVLGTDDFGVYNVVGGVVVLFSFFTNALTSSTQRFLNFSMGTDNESGISNVFNTAILTHLSVSVLVLFLAETLGLWFVNTQLNIPLERRVSVKWVYQMSVLTTLLSIIVIPYRASIIATERMSIFACISVLEAFLKLGTALVIDKFSYDSLILYSFFLFGVSFIVFAVYIIVCRRKLKFTKICLVYDGKQYKEMMSFSGWYLLGGMAQTGASQGTNILINMFYGVTVNAAVGIANQVKNAVFGFVSNFQTAFNPQIVKLYALGEKEQLLSLIYRSSKISYYMLFVISLPIILFCKEILSIWLVSVPDYAVDFTILVVVTSVIDALSAPLWTAIGATGNVKKYQILVSLIIFLDIPMIYVAFRVGLHPVSAFVINLVINFGAYLYRLLYVKKYINYQLSEYCRKVILPCVIVSLMSFPIPCLLRAYSTSIVSAIMLIFCSICITFAFIILFGFDKCEKQFLITSVKKVFTRR